MAKKKDEFSFGFSSKKKKEEVVTPAEGDASTETPAESSDPFASTPDASSDPFAASPDASSDPFASTEPAADPFASTEPAADPFASTDASADPFASTEPAADPFASTDTATADPFASTDTATADPFASTDAPADAPAETPVAEEPPAKKTPQIKVRKKFKILVMGDFTGRSNRQLMETGEAIASRKVHTVDSDRLDATVAKLKPRIELPISDTQVVPLDFAAMEDFRPDALIGKIDGFGALLKLREELKNPKTFKTAAAAVRKLTGEKKAKAPHAKKTVAGASDFENLLNQPVSFKNAETASAESFIAHLVAGYEVPDADPDATRLTGVVEEALSAGLRAVLRHPAFQAVETSWRGIEFLVTRLNTDEELSICLFDISKDELYADLHEAMTVEKSGIFQTVVEQTKVPGAEGYAVIVGNYTFEQTPRDIALLAKLATLGHLAGLPFLAAATPKVAGFESFNKFPDSGRWQPPTDIGMWEKIRAHKLAAHIGLAAPRFLMRLPYGPKTDAVEAFAFEEMPGNPMSANYLWGNGAFALAYGMGQGFLDEGWSFTPGQDVTDLPCHMAVVDGDKEMTPCAEGWLSDRMGDVLHNLGLIPLLSVRNAASVKIAGFHSIAKGGKALAAAWATA